MLRAVNYELTLEEHPGYMHATARGDMIFVAAAARWLREEEDR